MSGGAARFQMTSSDARAAQAGLAIKFVPQFDASFEDCSLQKLIAFTTRQLKITRVYAPHLWKPVLIGSVIFALTFFGGLALATARAAAGLSFATPLVVVLLMFAMGAVKSHLRLRAVALVMPDPRMKTVTTTLAHMTLWPFASLLFLYNAIAAFSRRIKWRGFTYELKSPTETVILSNESE